MPTYPYYIAEWYEGRISVNEMPFEHRYVPSIRRMYEDGRIGGKRLKSVENADLQVLLSELRRQGKSPQDVEFYIVVAPNQPKRRLQYYEIQRLQRRP